MRAPAIPLPMTTSLCFFFHYAISMNPTSTSTDDFSPCGPAASSSIGAAGRKVFKHCKRHVNGALGTYREIAHRLAFRVSTR